MQRDLQRCVYNNCLNGCRLLEYHLLFMVCLRGTDKSAQRKLSDARLIVFITDATLQHSSLFTDFSAQSASFQELEYVASEASYGRLNH